MTEPDAKHLRNLLERYEACPYDREELQELALKHLSDLLDAWEELLGVKKQIVVAFLGKK